MSLDDTGRPVREVLASDGSSVVLSSTSLVLHFDRYIDAGDAIRQAVCLRSSTDDVADPLSCQDGLFLRPSYDPVRRQLTFFQQDDQPRLKPDTLYQLTVFSPLSGSSFGVRAFDGAPLAQKSIVRFRTSPDTAVTEAEQLSLSSDYCNGNQCLAQCGQDASCAASCGIGIKNVLASCTLGGCHDASFDGQVPSMGLDLGSPEHIAATALARVAHQTQTGEDGDLAAVGSPRFGRAMPRIDPGNAGNSYLLYKILIHDELAAELPGLAPGETERLRSGFVVGLPMPALTHVEVDGTPNEATPIQPSDAVELSTWIAAGAQLNCSTDP